MAEAVQEKSRGLKFAEQQLLRHGWEQGKGLGREENGISEAIKVSVKCDKGGVGHRQGEQFSFHWWDHVFNKASSSLEVESDQNGVQVKKLVEEEEAGMISNKKPRKASLAKDKLYGCFVKSATLLSGQELPEQKTSSSDSSSSDDEDQRLDLSSTTQLSDADLMKACGGRTAHKGARHGLTMSAKLARLEQQEQEFMAKYGKTSQSAASPESAVVVEQSAQTPEVEAAVADETRSKKSKKKKKRKNDDAEEKAPEESAEAAVSESPEPDVTPKKKKKKKKRSSVEGGEAETEAAMLEEQPAAGVTEDLHARKKQRKSRRTMEEDSGRLNGTACETADTLQGETAGETAGEREEASDHDAGEGLAQPQTHTDPNIKHRKKKKKASKSERENTALDETENKDPGTAEDGVPNEKRGDGAGEVERGEEHDMVEEEEEREEPKMKRKKKRCKEDRQSAEHREQDGPATPKKKRKKTKERQKELD